MHRLCLAILAAQALAVPQSRLFHESLTFDANFANEGVNKATPPVDMGLYGDPSGQLPKAYDIGPDGIVYNATKSFEEFIAITRGTQADRKLRSVILAERSSSSVDKRQSPEKISFSLLGANSQKTTFNNLVCGSNPGADCLSPPKFTTVIVTHNNNCYFTFWSNTVCNGKNGRFAPACGTHETSMCRLNFQPSSFAVFDSCDTQNPSTGCRIGFAEFTAGLWGLSGRR